MFMCMYKDTHTNVVTTITSPHITPSLGTWVNNETAILHVHVHVYVRVHVHVYVHVQGHTHKCGNYYNLPTRYTWLGTWINNETTIHDLHIYTYMHKIFFCRK